VPILKDLALKIGVTADSKGLNLKKGEGIKKAADWLPLLQGFTRSNYTLEG
jgi:hypothetical protein